MFRPAIYLRSNGPDMFDTHHSENLGQVSPEIEEVSLKKNPLRKIQMYLMDVS
jgi:hypothetical protein